MIPQVPGLLTQQEAAATAAAIAEVQQGDGAVPWAYGGHIDAWNHVEAAMALLIGGEIDAATAAYDWCLLTQRRDGSFPIRIRGTVTEDASGDTNMTAYLAVGVWHHWLVRADRGFVRAMMPAVSAALDYVVDRQLPWGGIAWSEQSDGVLNAEALLAGSASIHHALRAGLALAELTDVRREAWGRARDRLAHALAHHRDLFVDKSSFSMDWYYPVLGGPVRGSAARDLLASRWDDFVTEGRGVRCVDANPWYTGAETCELVLALDVLGDSRARDVFAAMLGTRHEGGLYWTGFVTGEDVYWPPEQTTYTSAAVLLAADALSRTTGGSGIFRGEGLPALTDTGCLPRCGQHH